MWLEGFFCKVVSYNDHDYSKSFSIRISKLRIEMKSSRRIERRPENCQLTETMNTTLLKNRSNLSAN